MCAFILFTFFSLFPLGSYVCVCVCAFACSDSGNEQGVTADTAASSEDGFTFNDVLGMLFLDILLFSALSWYVNKVVPSEWGTSESPFFFLTKAYWCPGLASR